VATLEREMGGNPTSGQRELIQRAAMLSVLSQDAEVYIAQGKPIDVSSYCTLCNTQRRILQVLGLQRDSKLIDGNQPNDDSDDIKQLLSYFQNDSDIPNEANDHPTRDLA